VLLCVAVCCSVLLCVQCAAGCCSVLQCVAVWALPSTNEMYGEFRGKTCFARRKIRHLKLRIGSFFASTEVVQRPRSQSPLHVDIGTYSKFARKNNFLALGVCFPERWPQVCRVKITLTKLLTNRFVSTTKHSIKYVVNWIPLRIRVRSINT